MNDNKPIFNNFKKIIDIYENLTIGESIGNLTAYDLDSNDNSKLTYSIINGDDNNDFFIIPDNGNLLVNKNLDREIKSQYNLVIQANDNPEFESDRLSSTAQV